MHEKTLPIYLTDAEWACIEPHLPVPKASGRPRVHPLREILNAIFYVVKSGCPWRLLPHDFPPWKTVSTTTSACGAWMAPERGCTRALRQRVRVRMKRDSQSGAGIVDSQSAMDAGYTGEGKGADWAEKVLGWTVQIVRHPLKLAPDEVMRR
jgi:putative transposase